MKRVERRLPRRHLHLQVRRLGPRVADVLGDRGVEHEWLLIDERNVTAQIFQRQRAEIVAVQTDGAACRGRAGAARDRRSSTCRCRSVRRWPALHRRGRPGTDPRAPVRRDRTKELTFSNAMSPRTSVSTTGVAGSYDFDRHVEDLRHPAKRHARRRQVRIQAHQRLQRRQKPHLARHVGDEGAERQRSTNHLEAAVQKHRAGAGRQDQPGKPSCEVGEELHRHQRADELAVLVAEVRDLALLRVRRHDQPHALQRLDEEAADVGAALAQHRHVSLETALIAHERPDPERCGGRADEEQSSVEPDQHRDRADEEQHVAEPGERRFGRDPLDLADVVVDSRHDVAEPRAGVEARRQLMEVAVHRQPHVEEDVGRDARVAKAAEHVQAEARRAKSRRTARPDGPDGWRSRPSSAPSNTSRDSSGRYSDTAVLARHNTITNASRRQYGTMNWRRARRRSTDGATARWSDGETEGGSTITPSCHQPSGLR